MLTIRRDKEIHREEGGWFTARWHFSFGHYRDPANDDFGAMRVFNDDRLVPGAIWPMHPHQDVEGLTYVVEGSFRHEDSVGGAPGPLPAGAVQRMTLGSGALHSEQNASEDEPMRFIQIWVLPDTAGLEPEVEQKVFTAPGPRRAAAAGDGPRGWRGGPDPPGRQRARGLAGARRPGRASHRPRPRRLCVPDRRPGQLRRRAGGHRRRGQGDRPAVAADRRRGARPS